MLLRVERYGNVQGREILVYEGVTAIVGPNGSGKSTLLDAILYAIYGVDRFGQAARVSLHVEDAMFERERRGKNSRVRAVVGGVEVEQHRRLMEVLEQQGWLTLEQATITWFGRQGRLGFLDLSPRERRAVLEELLRLEAWEEAYARARAEREAARREIERVKGRLEEVVAEAERVGAELGEARKRLEEMGPTLAADPGEPPPYSLQEVERAERELAQREARLEELNREVRRVEGEVARLEGGLRYDGEKLAGLEASLAEYEAKRAELLGRIEAARVETPCKPEQRWNCPFARQAGGNENPSDLEVALSGIDGVIAGLKASIGEVRAAIERLEGELAEKRTTLQALAGEVVEHTHAIERLKRVVAHREEAERWGEAQEEQLRLHRERAQLEERLNYLERQAEELAGKRAELERKLEELNHLERVWTEAIADLGPKGVRHHLLATALPGLAERVNEILDALGLPLTVGFRMERELSKGGKGATLDVLLVRGDGEVSADTASGGERVVMDLAMRLALMEAYRQAGWKVPDVLVLDETLAPLDAERRVAVMAGLRKLGVGRVLVTSHVQELLDFADFTVEVGNA